MKKLFGIFVLSALLALNAFAQQTHEEGDGHDHSEDGKTSGKQARGESKTDYLWRMSDEAFHAGDYERAIGYHKEIVAIDPHDIESYSNAAWLMWSADLHDEALAHIERGLKANENNWQMWAAAGVQYDLQKPKMPALNEKSKIAYQRAVELLPKNADKKETQMLRRRLAHAAQKADDLELSVATWRALVADFPDEYVNKNNLQRVEKLLAEKQAEKKKVAMLPIVIGGASAAFIALLGASFRHRKLRAAQQTKSQTTSAA